MNQTFVNRCDILASGKASSLAYTVYDADGNVLQARVFGQMAEIGTTAKYQGPKLTIDATLSGVVVYDTDGTADAAGTEVDNWTFASSVPYAAIGTGGSGLTAIGDVRIARIAARSYGKARVNQDKSNDFFDVDDASLVSVHFDAVALPGGRDVILDPGV